MIEEITIAELLFRLKDKREKFDKLYKDFITKDNENNVFVTLKRQNNTSTLEGRYVEEFKDTSRDYHFKTLSIWRETILLSRIKDEVNSKLYLYLPIPTDTSQEKRWFSVNEILMLRSSYYKNYYIKFFEKIEDEYKKNKYKLSVLSEKINDKESIDRYVLARLNSLNIPFENGYTENYDKFSKEYLDANKIEIVSSTSIESIMELKEIYEDWCKLVDDKLFKLNTFTKIWINMTQKDNPWGIDASEILKLKEIDAKFETVA